MLRRRASQAVLLLASVSMLSFAFAELTPGDYYDDLLLDPTYSQEVVDAMRQRHGLDDPLPVRYGRWLRSMAAGDFGHSVRYNVPVGPLLLLRARNTLVLTVTATFFAWLVAIPLGAWAASSGKKWVRGAFAASTSTLLAIPDILLALLLLVFAAKTGIFPVDDMTSENFADLGVVAKIADLAHHLALPVLAIVLGLAPSLARQVHASLEEVYSQPFVRAAKARGIGGVRLLFGHALAAASSPLISLFGLSIASLLSSSLLVEVVLGWPGLGPLLLSSILSRDVDVVTSAVLLSTVLLVIGNGAADLLLLWVDPRAREAESAP